VISVPSNGTLAFRADGSFDYTPAHDFSGADSFTYRANDGDLDSADTTVSIAVNPINDAPIGVPDGYGVDEDVTLDVSLDLGVLRNDNDADSDVLTVALVSDVQNGTLTLNPADGSFRYVPGSNFNGTDGFMYTVTDGTLTSSPTAVTITVTPVGDPPLAIAGPDVAIRVGRLATIDGSASNDPDGGAPTLGFLWTFVAPLPAGSALTNADIAGAATAIASFTPDVVGTFVLNLEVSSGAESGSDQVNVVAGNGAPISFADLYSVDEDQVLDIATPGVLVNDSDPETDPITAILSSDVGSGVLVLNPNGSFRYTPARNFNGTDGFTYVATDGDLSGAPATVTITVNPVNDPPTATADTYTILEDRTLAVGVVAGVLANDNDDDSDLLTATLIDDVANGTLALAANGSFVYTPTAQFNGTDSFTYTAIDRGTVPTVPTTVTLTVDPENDAPIANAGPDDPNGVVGIEIPLDGTGSSDLDNDTLTYRWSFTEVPPGSTAPIVNPTAASASFVPDTSGRFVVQLIVNDGTVDSAPDTASFDVTFCTDLTVNWVTNASGAWDVGANWSTGAVPGPADDACIDVPASITVTHSVGTDSVRSLVSNEDVVLSGGVLQLAMPSVIHKRFTQNGNGGELTGAGNLRVRGLFTWASGIQSGSGQTIGEGGMSLAGTGRSLSGRTIVNATSQLASWTSGAISFGNGGGFVNNGTFSTDFNGVTSLSLGGARSGFTNNGTFEKTAGAGTTTLAFVLAGSGNAIVNSGGTLAFTGGGTNGVSFAGPGRITLRGADAVTPMVLSGSIGVADVVFNGGTVEVNGIYNVAGSTGFPSTAIVNFNAPATVSNLGALTVDGGTANFSSGEDVSASSLVQSNSATVSGSDRLVVSGTMTWSGGTQSGSGQTIVGGGMTLNGVNMTLNGRTIVNASGTTTNWTAGTFNSGNGGGFVNNGTFRTSFNGIVNFNQGVARSVFTNNGTFEKVQNDPNGTPSTLGTSRLAFALDNSDAGVVRSSFGTLEFSGGGASAGRFEGAATLAFSAGTMQVNGICDMQGATTIQNTAIANFNAPATASNLGALTVAGGTANFSTGKPVSASSLVQSTGILTGSDTITVSGSMAWSGGTQSGSGQTIVGDGMSLTGAEKTLSGRTIVNAIGKTASWTAGTFRLGNGGGFVNNGTFSTSFDSQANFNLGVPRSVFTNNGTFEKTGGAGNLAFGFALDNSGLVRSVSGTLSFTGGYAQTAGTTLLAGGGISASPTALGIQGGSLGGSGSVVANVTNAGSVAPAFSGPLSVTGTYTQSATGALEIELSGTGTPGTAYDRLTVSGAATLGGALNVSLVNGFVPASGDSFVVMSYASATGAFTSQNLPPLGGGLSWNVAVGPTAVTLSVGP
jgi:VCBS repeat-containing protein